MNSKKIKLRFGTAGIPRSTHPTSTPNGIYKSAEIGATTMEVEWVQGVRMRDELAESIRKAVKDTKIDLTAHAPYFINYNSPSNKTISDSVFRTVEALNAAEKIGIKSVAVHAGFNHGQVSVDVYPKIKKVIQTINRKLHPNVLKNVKLAVETMGKPSQFGSLLECIQLAKEFDNVTILLDIAHLFARTRGQMNTYDEFMEVFDRIENDLGKEALESLHMHISGIEYGPAGERRHLMLDDGKMDWRTFLHVCADKGVGGWLICESPDAEKDLQNILSEWKKFTKN